MKHYRALIASAVLVAGCSTSGTIGHTAPSDGPRATPTSAVREARPIEDRDGARLHLLSRVTFGRRPGDLERVRAMGVEAYLAQQLDPATIDDSAVDRALAEIRTLTLTIGDLQREYPRIDPAAQAKIASGEMTSAEAAKMFPLEKRPARIVEELAAAKILRAVGSERQLQEVMVDFWFNHFNVFSGKGETRWYVTAYEREAIRPHALGKFADLVRATARHPAMLYYLDNWMSGRPAAPNRGRRGGLNENYARELLELHTLGVDGGYTQTDVIEVARAFTGWTIESPRAGARFVFRPLMHDPGGKTVLGHPIPPGGGESDGDRVIEILTRHPSTARFIATKLVRRFVADDPPPPLVERVATTYTRTDGDLRAMLRTIFTAPEFQAESAWHSKIKTPLELVASAVRALRGTVDARGGLALARAVTGIGAPLYEAQPPTGYADRAEAWLSAGALLARMNFANALVNRRYAGVELDVVLSRELQESLARSRIAPAQLVDGDVEGVVALAIGSPEFQRR